MNQLIDRICNLTSEGFASVLVLFSGTIILIVAIIVSPVIMLIYNMHDENMKKLETIKVMTAKGFTPAEIETVLKAYRPAGTTITYTSTPSTKK